MDQQITRTEREALKAIYRLTRDHSEAQTGALAQALGLAPGTVTATLKRLAASGVVDYRPYHGVELTASGRRTAVAAIRRHRIVERFLADMLGYAWREADRLATAFEHDLPPQVEERMYVALDRPATCPHGFPIPRVGSSELPELPPLYDLEAGDVAVVAVPGSTDPDVVAFLETLGVRPGVRVEVREKHPFDGPLVLSVDGQERTIGSKVARLVYVMDVEAYPDRPPATSRGATDEGGD